MYKRQLEHPANDLVRTFMGKHTPDTAPSKVESFMRTNVFSVRKDRGVLELSLIHISSSSIAQNWKESTGKAG